MIDYTEADILKTRQHFIEQYEACIDDVLSGSLVVEDPEGVIQWFRGLIEECSLGVYDRSFAFVQTLIFLKTGESVPLLS